MLSRKSVDGSLEYKWRGLEKVQRLPGKNHEIKCSAETSAWHIVSGQEVLIMIAGGWGVR